MVASYDARPPSLFSPLFAALNWIALFGWCGVLFQVVNVAILKHSSSMSTHDAPMNKVLGPVLGLELICVVEVLRILAGDLPGNLVLGTVLHTIRITALTQVLPANSEHWTVPAVLISWAATEVARYPMYIFPGVESLRTVRMVVPLVTFPMGAFSEAYGAYLLFVDEDTSSALRLALGTVLFVNGFLGPTMAYPALLRKGLPALGLVKKKEKRHARKVE